MEFIKNNLIDSEVRITQAIYSNKENLLEIINKVNVDDFINEDMKILYNYAIILYNKYDFQTLDKERLKQIIEMDDKIEENFKEIFKINVEVFPLWKDLDIKGEYEIYSKNLSLYKYNEFIENNGGVEGLFTKMNDLATNTDDIRDFLLYNLDNCFNNYKSKPIESSIEQGMDELLDDIINNNMELGIKQLYNKYTNHFTGGIFKGVHYLGGHSGTGKTTWAFPFYILPILLARDTNNEMKEKLLIIANEQDKKTFQKLFLVSIYTYVYRLIQENNKLKDRFIRRHRLERGNATDLDKTLLNKAYKHYTKVFSNRVKFVFMPMFTPSEIERCIVSNARKGYTNVLLDTMKAEQKGEYQLLSNLATRLDMIAKANDLRIVATVQLAIHTMHRKYLDHTCLAESKQIVEIAEHSLYFRYTDIMELSTVNIIKMRPLYNDNNILIGVENEQILASEIEAIIESGLNTNKDLFLGMKLMLVFVGKNRHGESNKIILAMMNFDNMYYQEIGIVEGLNYDKF